MFQEITIVGNLGRDPEMRYLQDGTAVTNINVATSRRWQGVDGEPQEQTTWFRVSVWGTQAEAVNQYLEKGRQVLVKGTLQSDPQTGGPRLFNRQDGSIGASFEIRATLVKFLGSRQDGGDSSGAAHQPPTEEDEIPF